jgi:hypothetical protein
VNWWGDGQELLLLSGNPREGGMIDGRLRRAVVFPDDGHPDLCAAVRQVTGDPRDEIILWDRNRVWIYAPTRNPDDNDANYRTEVSLPNWYATKAD